MNISDRSVLSCYREIGILYRLFVLFIKTPKRYMSKKS